LVLIKRPLILGKKKDGNPTDPGERGGHRKKTFVKRSGKLKGGSPYANCSRGGKRVDVGDF